MKKFLSVFVGLAVLFAVSACKKREAAVSEDDYGFKIGVTMSLCNAPR